CTNDRSPGSSLAPLLRGERLDGEFDTVFYEMLETRVMRTREWLYVKHFDTQYKNELYNLLRDPGEQQNVIADPASADVLAEMDAALTKFFAEHAAPEFDLWNGGTMQHRLYRPQMKRFSKRPLAKSGNQYCLRMLQVNEKSLGC
ncbi:MAG: hypothetical protein WBB22_04660, partial [Anaerolineae bacterium]